MSNLHEAASHVWLCVTSAQSESCPQSYSLLSLSFAYMLCTWNISSECGLGKVLDCSRTGISTRGVQTAGDVAYSAVPTDLRQLVNEDLRFIEELREALTRQAQLHRSERLLLQFGCCGLLAPGLQVATLLSTTILLR
eukprot:3888710-Amphidinium_carterae.1